MRPERSWKDAFSDSRSSSVMAVTMACFELMSRRESARPQSLSCSSEAKWNWFFTQVLWSPPWDFNLAAMRKASGVVFECMKDPVSK